MKKRKFLRIPPLNGGSGRESEVNID